MDQTLVIVLVALLLAVVVALTWGPGVRGQGPGATKRWSFPVSIRPRRATLSSSRPLTPASQPLRWVTSRGRAGLLLLVVIAFLALWLVARLAGFGLEQPAPAGELVVRIAPFAVEGGTEREGRLLAEQVQAELAARLVSPVNLAVLQQAVVSPEAALAAAVDSGADLLLWGTALSGGTATTPSLQPRLVWLPDEPFEPRRWQGYDAHLTLQPHWELAAVPINGAAILPPLIDSLARFSRGDADRAADQLAVLQRDYDGVLRPELPATVRAMVLWAEGLLPDAESEAQRALAGAPTAAHWNNLGAVLLDQRRNDLAHEALLRALALEPNLVAAHTNLGRLFMNEDRPADALPDLRTAAQLAPRPVVLASLAEAARRAGQLALAREVVGQVLRQEPTNGPALSERAMLALTDVTTATGELEWELEAIPRRSAAELAAVRAESEQAITLIEALHASYLRRGNAYGVDGRPAMQRLMEMQARRLEEDLLNRRYQQMLTLIEQGRVVQGIPRSGLRRFWDTLRGVRTPLHEAISLANTVLRQAPGGSLQYDLQYQRGRAAYLSGDSQLAQQAWDEATTLTTTGTPTATLAPRPEALYGRARLLLDAGQRGDAAAELDTALAADQRFFPARRLLATLASEDGRWADAEVHLRWLADNRPSTAAVIELATALREQGRLADAEALLLPLANRADAPSLVLLARMYREAGQLDAAQAALDRAQVVSPATAEIYEELALIVLARPDPNFQAVEQHLRRSIKIAPTRAGPHLELGKLLAGPLGRPAEATDEFKAALALNANDPLAYRRLGEILLENGAPDAAVDSFSRALRIQPASHEAHHGLATAYLALGRLDDAETAERKALELAGGNYTLAIVGLGDIFRERGQYDEAITEYNTALERDPALVTAYLGLGQTASARGNPAIALGHYQRGLEATPNHVPLLLALGNAQLAIGNTDAASATFARVKELSPGNAAAFAGAGEALWKSGRSEEALRELGEAVQRNPTNAAVYLTIGDVNAALDRPVQALEAYERASAVRKDWYEPHFRRGVLLLGQQRTAEAIDALRATVKLNDEFAQGHYWLGRAYRAAGRYTEAVRELKRAVALQPGYYEARYFLGRALDEQGDGEDARAAYTALIAEAPEGDQWRVEAERELNRIQ